MILELAMSEEARLSVPCWIKYLQGTTAQTSAQTMAPTDQSRVDCAAHQIGTTCHTSTSMRVLISCSQSDQK